MLLGGCCVIHELSKTATVVLLGGGSCIISELSYTDTEVFLPISYGKSLDLHKSAIKQNVSTFIYIHSQSVYTSYYSGVYSMNDFQ